MGHTPPKSQADLLGEVLGQAGQGQASIHVKGAHLVGVVQGDEGRGAWRTLLVVKAQAYCGHMAGGTLHTNHSSST